jgi:hypothetical protein
VNTPTPRVARPDRVPHHRRRHRGQRAPDPLGDRARAQHAELDRGDLDVGHQRPELRADDLGGDRIDREERLGGLLGQRGGDRDRADAVGGAHPDVGEETGPTRRIEAGDHQDLGLSHRRPPAR